MYGLDLHFRQDMGLGVVVTCESVRQVGRPRVACLQDVSSSPIVVFIYFCDKLIHPDEMHMQCGMSSECIMHTRTPEVLCILMDGICISFVPRHQCTGKCTWGVGSAKRQLKMHKPVRKGSEICI